MIIAIVVSAAIGRSVAALHTPLFLASSAIFPMRKNALLLLSPLSAVVFGGSNDDDNDRSLSECALILPVSRRVRFKSRGLVEIQIRVWLIHPPHQADPKLVCLRSWQFAPLSLSLRRMRLINVARICLPAVYVDRAQRVVSLPPTCLLSWWACPGSSGFTLETNQTVKFLFISRLPDSYSREVSLSDCLPT